MDGWFIEFAASILFEASRLQAAFQSTWYFSPSPLFHCCFLFIS